MRLRGRLHEQSAGASAAGSPSMAGVKQDGEEELGDRVRPRRVVSERLQDPDGGFVFAAQHRANAVLGCRLRRSRRGEQRKHAGKPGARTHHFFEESEQMTSRY
jgi:hypothetical protein